MNVGLVSDTHGLVRPELIEYLQGVDVILHAGDIGKPEVVAALENIAPVHAIRGNVDREPWADAYQETMLHELCGVSFYLVHSRDWLDIDPESAGVRCVLSGHSHKPELARGEVVFVNPGSPGPERFSLPVSAGRAVLEDGLIKTLEIRELLEDECLFELA